MDELRPLVPWTPADFAPVVPLFPDAELYAPAAGAAVCCPACQSGSHEGLSIAAELYHGMCRCSCACRKGHTHAS